MCEVEGCDKPRRGRHKLCAMHYNRKYRNGDVNATKRRTSEIDIRDYFWLHVDTSGDCWTWTFGTNKAGYGVLNIGSRIVLTHRYVLDYAGPLKVLHSCDNPPCVNPAHLRIGTDLENIHDMIERGRGWWQNGYTNGH